MFCLLLPWCGLITFPLLPKRTVSDQGCHVLIKAALVGVGELGSGGMVRLQQGKEGACWSQRDPLTLLRCWSPLWYL